MLLVKRSWEESVNIVNTDNNFVRSFALSDIPTSPREEITKLFDYYKLCMVKVTFQFDRTGPDIQAAGTEVSCPIMYYAVDKNDGNTPAIASLLEYQRVQQRRLDSTAPFSVTFKPCFARPAYASLVSTGYSPARGWINTETPNVPHYGLKWSITSIQPGVGDLYLGRLNVRYTYFFACKSTK